MSSVGSTEQHESGGGGLAGAGAGNNVPPLTWLYVPADRPDRVEKAIASRAHAVIVDLEDGVAPAAKEQARASLPELLGSRREKPVFVRVNAGSEADLEVVRELVDAAMLGAARQVVAIAERYG